MNNSFKLAVITALALAINIQNISAEESASENIKNSAKETVSSTGEIGGKMIDNTAESGKSTYEQTKDAGGKIIDNLGETADSTGNLVKKMYHNTKETLSGK